MRYAFWRDIHGGRVKGSESSKGPAALLSATLRMATVNQGAVYFPDERLLALVAASILILEHES